MSPAKLDAEAHARLEPLRAELRRHGLPGRIKNEDILSALVMYSTAPQVAGMLAEYWRYTGEQEATDGS